MLRKFCSSALFKDGDRLKRKRRNLDFYESIENTSEVSYSGNSDVDVKVIIDTTPIAYAMLCTLLSTNQITNDEFKNSVQQLDELIKHGKSHLIEDVDDLSYENVNQKLLRR